MGKKSNAKKIIRELIREKQQKEKQKGLLKQITKRNKSKKELKEELKGEIYKPKEPKKAAPKKTSKPSRFKVHKRQIFGAALGLIMLGILVAVGFLLFQKAFRPENIARYLPQDGTVFTLEMNTNFDHHQIQKAETLLKNYPEFTKDGVIKSLETAYNFNYQKDVSPWLGRQAGLSLVSASADESLEFLYFAEVFSKKNAETFLAAKALKSEYANFDLYIFPKGESATFVDDYLFFSPSQKQIESLIDFQNSSDKALFRSASYRRINDNLPLNKVGMFYVNFSQIDNRFFEKFPILSEKGFSAPMVSPFLKLLEAEGVALIALDDKFALQSFLSLNTDLLENEQYLTLQEKYSANLANYISAENIGFWGGQNFETQLKRMMEVLGGSDENLTIVFDKILQQYSEKYFGGDVNFQNDVLPLFKNEFALAIEKHNKENVYKFLIELKDLKNDKDRLELLAENFARTGAVLKPQVVDYTLPDGTPSKEIVAVPEPIIPTETTYENYVIHSLTIGTRKRGVFYSIVDDFAVIANDIAGVKSSIDFKNGKGGSLQVSSKFDNSISPILLSSDEVAYMNFEELLPVLFKNKVPDFLIPISEISFGKNYFNDGITTLSYLQIK